MIEDLDTYILKKSGNVSAIVMKVTEQEVGANALLEIFRGPTENAAYTQSFTEKNTKVLELRSKHCCRKSLLESHDVQGVHSPLHDIDVIGAKYRFRTPHNVPAYDYRHAD